MSLVEIPRCSTRPRSEQFRSSPRTWQPLCGRLSMRRLTGGAQGGREPDVRHQAREISPCFSAGRLRYGRSRCERSSRRYGRSAISVPGPLTWRRTPRIPSGAKRNRSRRGQEFSCEYRWADGRYDRLLPSRPNSWGGGERDRHDGWPQPARAALAATSTIPVVFTSGSDPVRTACEKSDRPAAMPRVPTFLRPRLGQSDWSSCRIGSQSRQCRLPRHPTACEIAEIQVKEVVEAAAPSGSRSTS